MRPDDAADAGAGVDADANADARDLSAALAGDHAAFGRLYDRHAAVVLSLCRRSCGTGSYRKGMSDAEDAAQETFIRAYSMLERLDGQIHSGQSARAGASGLRSWLYAIARRVCSEQRRAASRRIKHEAAAMIDHATRHHEEDSSTRQMDRHATAEQLDRLTLALAQLDDGERLAIHLHYLEVDPVQAGQSALGLSRSGYYKLLGKAREKLAALMADSSALPLSQPPIIMTARNRS